MGLYFLRDFKGSFFNRQKQVTCGEFLDWIMVHLHLRNHIDKLEIYIKSVWGRITRISPKTAWTIRINIVSPNLHTYKWKFGENFLVVAHILWTSYRREMKQNFHQSIRQIQGIWWINQAWFLGQFEDPLVSSSTLQEVQWYLPKTMKTVISGCIITMQFYGNWFSVVQSLLLGLEC